VQIHAELCPIIRGLGHVNCTTLVRWYLPRMDVALVPCTAQDFTNPGGYTQVSSPHPDNSPTFADTRTPLGNTAHQPMPAS
jgi:hypothetical protein